MPIDVKGRRPTIKERPRRCFIISKRRRKRCADEFLSYGEVKGSLLPIAAVRFRSTAAKFNQYIKLSITRCLDPMDFNFK